MSIVIRPVDTGFNRQLISITDDAGSSGHPPFAAPTYSSVFQLKAHAEALAPPIREQRPEVPEALASAVERMLAKDRKGRFASPTDVVATLQPLSALADLVGLFPAKPPSAALAA